MKYVIVYQNKETETYDAEINARIAYAYSKPYGAQLYVEFENGCLTSRYELN